MIIYKVNKYSLEKEFENVLKQHPYLIDDSLIGGSVENQYKITLSNGTVGYIDIVYFKENEITIIELKKEKIIKKDLSQLSDYTHQIKKLFPNQNVKGILIGQYLDDKLKGMLDLLGFTFKSYFYDIPLNLKICKKCRKVIEIKEDKCKWCNDKDFLPFNF